MFSTGYSQGTAVNPEGMLVKILAWSLVLVAALSRRWFLASFIQGLRDPLAKLDAGPFDQDMCRGCKRDEERGAK
jgi:hypothetical protein